MENNNCVTLLGVRGSVAVSGKDYRKYGGATFCAAVRMSGKLLVIDAGTGILHLPSVMNEEERAFSLLFTHTHADHLLGLLTCPAAYRKDMRIDCYASSRGGLSGEEQVCRLYAPPLWPVGPDSLPVDFRFHEMERDFTEENGGLRIHTMEGFHPDGVSLLRIEDGQRSVVVMTDCTLKEELTAEMTAFAADCDLLLIDGQYSDAEWERKKTFGHNTWTSAARFAVGCRAKQTRILHHDPQHTDEMLDRAAEEIAAIHPSCRIAYENEVIPL